MTETYEDILQENNVDGNLLSCLVKSDEYNEVIWGKDTGRGWAHQRDRFLNAWVEVAVIASQILEE